jgi:hypothetical protein
MTTHESDQARGRIEDEQQATEADERRRAHLEAAVSLAVNLARQAALVIEPGELQAAIQHLERRETLLPLVDPTRWLQEQGGRVPMQAAIEILRETLAYHNRLRKIAETHRIAWPSVASARGSSGG